MTLLKKMQTIDIIKKRFLQSINELVLPSDKILLTVSGGIDSVVMLHLFLQTDFTFAVAHCNFQLRGKDADDDEAFVKQLSEQNQLPFYTIRFETKDYAEQLGISIQMAARELRYEWFREIARKNDYNYIATAHQRNDVLETFFVNALRKTGIKGLCGIQAKSGNIIRPLLSFSRQEISDYAETNKIVCREDKSNLSDYYTRNYIRHHIIPEFRKLQNNFEDSLYDTISILNQQEIIYHQHIEKAKQGIVFNRDNTYIIDIKGLKQLPENKTYLFEWIYPLGFNMNQCENIIASLDGESGKTFYSDTHCLLKDRDTLIIKSKSVHLINQRIENHLQSDYFEDANLIFEYIPYSESFDFQNDTDVAYFDADRIQFPLIIRNWEHGDAFYPFGMQGSKKVSDFFNDHKISLFEKETVPILCNGNNDIIWIIGFRSDNRYRISSETKTILKISRI